jgi:hypothetical protein
MAAPPKTVRLSAIRKAALAKGYRSGLEDTVSKSLDARGMDYDYERHVIRYDIPARTAKYTPDFVLPNGMVIETKGLWTSDDRKKIALVKAQHPDIDLRMVFNNPQAKISKGSKTTYADVCIKLGVPFAPKDIPSAWLNEPRNEASVRAIEKLK